MGTLRSLPRDPVILEVGAYKGGTSLFILEACKRLGKTPKMYVFDTFEGHVTNHINDPLHHSGAGNFKDTSYGSVTKLLSDFASAEVVKGDATETVVCILQKLPGGVDFLHLDTDVYPVTLSVLKSVWPKLNRGGVVIIDDYGTTTCPGVFQAVNEFVDTLKTNCVFALTSVTNQKFLVKTKQH